MKSFYSNGKLLLTGEYVVLDGATALALPTTFGQSLDIKNIEKPSIIWNSLDHNKHVWFEDTFNIKNNEITHAVKNDSKISSRLLEILNTAKQLNSEFLNDRKGFLMTSALDFPQNWGLGSSSTLINNIANWANINAYELLELTFGGSGYDIACAQHDTAITYQLNSNKSLKQTSAELSTNIENDKRIVNKVCFNPEFKDHLYFVYLNKKQDSREGIAQYKKNTSNLEKEIDQISKITEDILSCKTLNNFNVLIDQHEQIISKLIHKKPIKKRLFSNFNGSIKSLGAWGGDFILVSSKKDPTLYFKNKGYTTLISFTDMIL